MPQGRHVVVTGGGSGIGAAIARAASGAGATVTVMGRRAAPLEAVAGETGAFPVTADVTDAEGLGAALDAARDRHGPIHVAVANAGDGTSAPFDKMAASDLSAMMDAHLMGTVHLWQAALADMKAAGWGRLIAVASVAGLRGYPYITGYCAAKHAVVGLTRALAVEVARTGITANALCPGYVDTPMTERTVANIAGKTGGTREDALASLNARNPQRRLIDPEEVAAHALWLCSDAARSVTGQALAIAGGEL